MHSVVCTACLDNVKTMTDNMKIANIRKKEAKWRFWEISLKKGKQIFGDGKKKLLFHQEGVAALTFTNKVFYNLTLLRCIVPECYKLFQNFGNS